MCLKQIKFVLLVLGFFLELCKGASIFHCMENERNALLDFKKDIKDEYNRLASWTNEDCCSWEGVSCHNVTGHVISLDLHNPHPVYDTDEWSLRGHPSPSLLGLKHLRYLDLSMNHFDGPIPKFFGSLHNLRYLDLSLAGFNGLIPHHLGNLSRLKYLYLNNGYGNEAIVDDAHWISRLTSLKHLTMENMIFENFQALNMLPNIAELIVRACSISAFPPSLPHVNFTNLSYLVLSNNIIDLETIPLWLFNIKSLTHIDLSFNYFHKISDALKNSTSIGYIDFSDNQLGGALPQTFKNLTSLEYINFSGNEFSGALPQAFKNLCKMHTLYIRESFFHGGRGIHEFRDIFSGCLKDSIENLDLSYNDLNGNLPDWFGELHMLKALHLEGNKLSGSIPELFGELHMLKTLHLEKNLLSGCIPESLGRLAALEELVLSNNNLNGTIPISIWQLSNLVHLNLNENHLEGVISDAHFAKLRELEELSLQSNNLILNLSNDWIAPFKLNIINLGSCEIGPKFPTWLQTQANVWFLNLSSSGIVDSLPNWFWNVFATYDTLVMLDLSDNGITGSLPPLSKIFFYHFDLSSNFFEGPLPPSLNTRRATVVDISNNSFSGSIHHPIVGNQTLSYLFLFKNNFSGEIPSYICLLDAYWIDLSENMLTGELPNCWNQLAHDDSPKHFDFSRNNLSGNIPDTFGTLTGLLSLHLGNNNLSGSIPSTLKSCTELITLDLGQNKLEGKIPEWLGENLKDLKDLVLRFNNFVGNIPSNLSNLKYLQILDLGNNKLSGMIPRSFGNFTFMMNIHPKYDDLGFLGTYDSQLPYLTEYLHLVVKGRNWKYDKILTQVTLIDLSCNNLSAQIPKELGNLIRLYFLNLSGNHLFGSIPDEIGLMHSLESLDLSRNELSGKIPSSMSTMTTLDFLNVSYNNLSGRIPSGTQLQSFTVESYIGNPKLCGPPLTQPCDINKTTDIEGRVDEVTESYDWYVSTAAGFVIGSWIVWGAFILNKKWKDAYFGYVDYVYDAMCVAVAVSINRFKRNIGNGTTSA